VTLEVWWLSGALSEVEVVLEAWWLSGVLSEVEVVLEAWWLSGALSEVEVVLEATKGAIQKTIEILSTYPKYLLASHTNSSTMESSKILLPRNQNLNPTLSIALCRCVLQDD
jgi:hypothetical protein